LVHLAGWFGKVAQEPAALWWVAGYNAVHPQLIATVEWNLRHGAAVSESARRVWQLLLERFQHSPEHPHSDGWFPFVWRLEREGWSASILRDFERASVEQLSNRPE
jgi:hypothetical protein